MTSLDHVEIEQAVEVCTGSCNSCPSVGSCADRVVCRCLNVIEDEVITAIRVQGARTVRQLKELTGAGDGCMGCRKQLRHYLTVYATAHIRTLATVG